MFPVRLKVNKLLTEQKLELIEMLEDKINRNISYGSIAPSILHAFEIRDLSITSSDNSGEELIKIERLRLQFDLFRFRFGNPINAFSGLLIVNSQIQWDQSKNSELLEVIGALTDGSGNPSASKLILPADFTIKGRNIGVRVDTEGFSAELEHLFFSLGTSVEKDLSLSLKADSKFSVRKLPDSVPVESIDIRTDLKLGGRIDSGFQWANLKIETKNFISTLFSVDRLRWNLNYNAPGVLNLTKIGDNIPADFKIEADIQNGTFEAALRAQDFIFSRYFKTSGLPKDFESITKSIISGDASMSYLPDIQSIIYGGDLQLDNITGVLEQPLSLTAEFSGINKSIDVSRSLVSGSIGKAGFSGSINLENDLPLINGSLRIPEIKYNEFEVSSSLQLRSSVQDGYHISAKSTELNSIILENLSLSILPYGENIEYRLKTDLQTTDEKHDHLFSEGIIQLGKEYYIQAMLSTDGILIAPIANGLQNHFSVPDMFNGFELASELFLSGTLEQLSFASPLIRISDRNNEMRSLSFALSGNNSGFRLSDLDLLWDNNQLKGMISSDLTEENALILKTNLDLNGTAVNTAGVYNTDGSLSLSGDYDLKFNLFKPAGAGNNFQLQTSRLPITSKNGNISYISIKTNGFFNSLADWRILVNDFMLEDIPTGYGSGNLGFGALLSPEGGSIYKLTYADKKSELRGGGSVYLSELTPFPSGRAYLSLSSVRGAEEHDLVVGFNKSYLEGLLNFTAFPISRISPDFPFSGDINGRLSIAGTPASPQLRLLMNTGNAVFNNERLQLDAVVNYQELKLQIEDISGSYSSLSFDNFSGLIDLENGSHNISGGLQSDSSLFNLDAGLSARAVTDRIDPTLDFSDLLSGDFEANIEMDQITLNEIEKDPWSVNIVRREKLMNITGGSRGEITASYFKDGYFSLSAVTPFPVSLSASGTIKDGSINATMNDINYVFDDLQIPYFRFYKGALTGNLRIQGPLNDPDFFGRLDFTNMEFKPPVVMDITKPFNPSFYISGKDITVPATRITTNNGIIDVNLTASMERWLPRNYDINITVPKGNEISAQYYWSPIYIYGFASGFLHLYGDLSHMWIDGNLAGSEAVFMVNSNLDIESIGRPTEFITSEMNFDLGENNQFFWPSQELPIVKGFLQGGSKLSMLYDSATTGLILNGNLKLNGGEIFYFERNFYIKEGAIKFVNNSIDSMDPLLSTRAEIRDINSEGEMTKIYLIVDQSPLSSFTPRFESDPPLSTAEIISMIGGNIFETFEGGDFDWTNALLLTTDLFTQFAILKGIEDSLKSNLGLDLLSIRSSFLSNFLENTFFTPSGELTQDNFAKYLDNTTLFLGKYFTDDIFLQGMFQFDLYNDTGYSESPGLNLDSEIKLEWEGPVANVELSFYPDFMDPIAGLNKTSVGLSWRFSY